MNTYLFSENIWLYPDTDAIGQSDACVHAARNSYSCIQLLGESLSDGQPVELNLSWDTTCRISYSCFELLPVVVDENTDSVLMTTTDFSRCKDFVTRKAPFQVYDALRPWDGKPRTNRLALLLRFYIPASHPCGEYDCYLKIEVNGESSTHKIKIVVHHAKVPALSKSNLGMMNFFCFDNLTDQHGAKANSPAYWALFREYVKSQLYMRCTHIMLPNAVPIRNHEGRITDFDFSGVIKAAKIALEEKAPYIVGAAIAHWAEWNDNQYFLLWDKGTNAETVDAYLQLKIYFSKWAAIVKKYGWQKRICQSLADEPQTHNDTAYRALSAIFRRFLPGVPVIEAVETFNLGGSIDVWVPKQDTFEKYMKEFQTLQKAGETMWYYTCAFPAGRIMNRSMDLPALVSREILWMGSLYGLEGFLHWGFNFYIGGNIWEKACCPHKGKLLPAGDAHIVYPGKKQPWGSLRYELHRAGAEDYELFELLKKKDPDRAKEIIQRVCTSFRDYTSDSSVFEEARLELLSALDEFQFPKT